MESLHQGKGIPENIRGVWTAQDDAALASSEFERSPHEAWDEKGYGTAEVPGGPERGKKIA